MTRIFDAEETASRLPYPELAESIREVALAMNSGELQAPPRLVLSLSDGGVLLVMPASDQEISITKLVTVHPDNPGRSLPTIQGEVVVMKAATGERLGLLEGSVVTARRTAALSMLAASELAPHPGGPLLVVGAGTQGRSHLEAFREGLGVSKVFISSLSGNSATSLAEHARSLGMDARAVGRPQEVLDEVNLVVTATTSREPVLPDEVPHGTFVAAVGSFEREAAELSPALISTAQVFVDSMEGAKEEAGDLIQAARAGAFRWEDATALEDALRSSGRPEGTVVFKSVGHALWDLAAARTAFVDQSRNDTS
ncbi:MAG TPA: delta(1)-pyrroline-2-carboxylate reductase family protein [Rubrobacter sp.]